MGYLLRMDAELTPDQAEHAQVYLRAMAAAIEAVSHASAAEERRSAWFAFEENMAKLHKLLPALGDPEADEGPYTAET